MMPPTERQAQYIDDKAEHELQAWIKAQQFKFDMFIAFNTGRIDPTGSGNRIGRGLGEITRGKTHRQ